MNSETQQNIESIGGVVKILEKGNLYKYIVGRFSSLSEMPEFRKSEVAKSGFSDFIYLQKKMDKELK